MIDTEKLQVLLRPFPPSAIQALPGRGNSPSLPYIREQDLVKRLNEVDPNWCFEVRDLRKEWRPGRRKQGDGWVDCEVPLAAATGVLTVCGVTRMDRGEFSGSEAEPEKSAVTDAFKRACRKFGVGLYLLNLPKKDVQQLTVDDYAKAAELCGWRRPLKQGAPPTHPEARQAAPAPAPAPPAPAAPPAAVTRPALTDEEDKAAAVSLVSLAAAALTAGLISQVDCDRVVEGVQKDTVTREWVDRLTGQIEELFAQKIEAEERDPAEPTPKTNGNGAARTYREEPRPEAGRDALMCSEAGCGRLLTKGQSQVSQRAFGKELCPDCQRKAGRNAAA